MMPNKSPEPTAVGAFVFPPKSRDSRHESAVGHLSTLGVKSREQNHTMKKLIPLLFAVGTLFLLVGGCTMPPVSVPDHNSVLDRSRVLKGSDKFVTPDALRPPVEITIVAKTDSTNLRMGYAADQVILNWEVDRNHSAWTAAPLMANIHPAPGRFRRESKRVPGVPGPVR